MKLCGGLSGKMRSARHSAVMLFLTLGMIMAISVTASAASFGTAAYVRAAHDPWGSSSTNATAMTAVFGAENQGWTTHYMSGGLGPFAPGSGISFVYLDASDQGGYELDAYLANYGTQIEQFVSSGGALCINIAPNDIASLNLGFGGISLNRQYISTAVAADAGHPVVNGPMGATGATWSGNYFAHAAFSGGGLSPVIFDQVTTAIVLGEKTWGAGFLMVGGMTTTNHHLPQPQAGNLRANILKYGAAKFVASPTVATGSSSAVTATGATLSATVDDNGANTAVTFEYGLAVGYGSSASGGTVSAGAGSTAVNAALAGLACNTTYHYRVVGVNSAGTSNGDDAAFTTGACPVGPPTVTTGIASAVTMTGATLNGTVTANGSSTTVSFEYGQTVSYGSIASSVQSPLAAGASGSAVSAAITGLNCGTRYHYRVKGQNSSGSGNGPDNSFTTNDCPAAVSPGDIITVAGSGAVGDDGPATEAYIHVASGAALDSAGNLFIADTFNHRIRRVAAGTGIITTVAGTGTPGFAGDDVPATSANLYYPSGVAVDSAGNLFIADSLNHRIRKVATGTGFITTVAGNGTATLAGDNGAATSASLNNPNGVTVDSAGNLYIADTDNHSIRKVAAGSGIISTVAGNGTGTFGGDGGAATTASLYSPHAVILDGDGNLYIADRRNHRVRKVAAGNGIISTVAGNGTAGYSGDNGAATSIGLNQPSGVALDSSGNLYIADLENHRVLKVAVGSGIISTVAGNGIGISSEDGGAAIETSLRSPTWVTVDGAGTLYIAERPNGRIRTVAGDTGIISTVAGNGVGSVYSGDGGLATTAGLHSPGDVAVDGSGNLFIADSLNHRIRKVAAGTGIITTVAGNGTAGFGGDEGLATAASLCGPTGVTIDSVGNLYFADSCTYRIRKVAAGSGIITTVAGNGIDALAGDGELATSASLDSPLGMIVDGDGNLYVFDSSSVRKVAADSGIITTVAGNRTSEFSGDGGPATLAGLWNISGVAVDSAGNLYIVDSGNHRIRKVAADSGVIITVAGGVYPAFGGLATSAGSVALSGVAVDSVGSLYIADSYNDWVRKVAADTGIISTVAGNGIAAFSGDGGAATSASINSPYGVAVDNAGNLYIADSGNNRIRKVINPGGVTTAAISYSQAGPYKAGDLITITASFSHPLADEPAPQIALDGANTLAATNMTKVDTSHYSYLYTVTAGIGSVTVSLPAGVDRNGFSLSPTPSSGATFSVSVAPAVATGTASMVTTTAATLNATVNDSGANTTVTFAYGLTTGYGTGVSGGAVSAGTGSTAVNSAITGLACGTTYHFRVVGVSSAGTSNGDDATFSTNPCPVNPPTVTTGTASAVSLTGATLNGIVSSNQGATTAGFEYGLTTGYGHNAPAIQGTLADGASGAAVSATLFGLTCATTYHYRVTGQNFAGTANGLDATFTTSACPVITAPGDIFTLAGGGIDDNIAATLASIYPNGVTVDSAGNLYIADYSNNRIRKVAADSGIITTVAGNGNAAFAGDGGAATSASLNNPRGVTVDGDGNLYIADTNNYRIRKVAAGTGIITTAAGKGLPQQFSGDGGLATLASFKYPVEVTVDSAGNLYVADSMDHRIRKVAADSGIITTVAGNGTGTFAGDGGAAASASINSPYGVTVDGAGNLYIADKNNHRIRKVAAGIISTVAGIGTAAFSGDGGAAASAGLNYPSAVTLDGAGNLFIADQYNRRVRKVTGDSGTITTVAGNGMYAFAGDGGSATSASLSPSRVAVDGAGNIFIADVNRIRKVAADSGIITTVAGNGTSRFIGDGGTATAAMLENPFGVALDGAGNLYLADTANQRIRKVAAGSGIITTVAGNGTSGFSGDGGAATSASLSSPQGVSLDSAGNLYIADRSNHRIRKVDAATGIISTVAGNGTAAFGWDGSAATVANLNYPWAVTVDGAGNLYIADGNNHRIRKVAAATGIISTVAGNGFGFSGDGAAATLAKINTPNGIVSDSAGNLYIADSSNNRIRKVAADTGIISTVAGNGAYGFTGDGGAATSASIDRPSGLALDSAGNLYIADKNNNRIRMVAADSGIISTVAGNGSALFAGDGGPAISASLNLPTGVAADQAGNLYVADQSNRRIRKVIKPAPTTAVISYDPPGTYQAGDQVTISATFNDLVSDVAAVQIALGGANTLAASAMSRVDYSHYSYSYTVTAGSGTVTVSLPSGIDSNGVPLAATPSSGANFTVITPVTVPGAPTAVSAAAGNGRATVSFTPPASDGGSAITSFTVTSTPGNLTATGNASPITVTGLSNGTAYTFSVTATNAAGTGAVSAASTSVTPVVPVYVLTLTFAGTGGGAVNGGMSCGTGTGCTPAVLAENTTVSLMPTPDADSLFGGWGGSCIVTGETCSVTMDGAKDVTATFNAAPRLSILGGAFYGLLSEAYAEAASNAVIQARALVFNDGDLICNRPVSVFFKGGYNAGFSSNSGETAVKGRLLIRNGTVRLKNLVLR